MSEFKGTKGKWILDEECFSIKNKNVNGLLATTWSTYNNDLIEVRNDGESWLEMRRRTDHIRIEKEE